LRDKKIFKITKKNARKSVFPYQEKEILFFPRPQKNFFFFLGGGGDICIKTMDNQFTEA